MGLHIYRDPDESELNRPVYYLTNDNGGEKVAGPFGPGRDAYHKAIVARAKLRDAQPPAADAGAGMEVE